MPRPLSARRHLLRFLQTSIAFGLAVAACGGGGGNSGDDDDDPICTPSSTRCDGDDVVRCSADGFEWQLVETCGAGESCTDGACITDPTPTGIETLTADQIVVVEHQATTVQLSATYKSTPRSHGWHQRGGPNVDIIAETSSGATIDVSHIDVGTDTVLSFELTAEWDPDAPGQSAAPITDTATIEVAIQAIDLVHARSQIGGATVVAAELVQNGVTWALHNRGGELRAVGVAPGSPVYTVAIGAYIRDIEVVAFAGKQYALLALGTEGIGVVDITDVSAMQNLRRVRINYAKLGVTFAEGGGDILTEDLIGTRSRITALDTDGTTLWIANADFGLQRTALSNLLGGTGPVLEADGTLLIDAEHYTQQYAGEHPWGGLLSLERHGDRIFAAQEFLGLGIFDAVTLEQVGRYNLYTDLESVEDWFIGMDVATQVHTDTGVSFLDSFTGMPDYRQANFEIKEVWKNGIVAPTPWADFDRYGKYYYNAQDVTVAEQGERSIAYIAYGLGGLVAVDVTGYATATSESFLVGDYLGYAPGVPAHGPDDPREDRSKSLYPYYGAGMLKEAGVTQVFVDGTRVLYTDHFAGLVVLDRADAPHMQWRQAGGPFDNDAPVNGNKVLGDHSPDYEFVTSYDMSPWDPNDHESLPAWMYTTPALVVTGEIGGHGRGLVPLGGANISASGGADVLLLAGAGGMAVMDVNLAGPQLADRFTTLSYVPSTDEIGAAVDGTPTASINMGHTQGITSTPGYLYVGDGPHGVTAWDILDENGLPIDDPHVVANTLQDEYPETYNGTTVYPATHAWGVVYEPSEGAIYATCQSVGLRRVSVAGVEAGNGAAGAPLLLAPQPTDIFEHNSDAGRIDGFNGQDHVYDVVRRGNLAFVADGTNGLTIYDVTKDPTVMTSGFFVGNVGSASGRPPLGRATGVALWTQPVTGTTYAFVAAGQFGIGVVDVTDVTAPRLVKTFEPIKIEDGKVGHADGRNVDVHVVGDHVFFSYTSFGVLSYTIADLIAPLPPGVDPTELWRSGGDDGVPLFDYRPVAVGQFKLDTIAGYEELDVEALYMEYTNVAGRLLFYVAYGAGGVAILDWTNPAAPALVAHVPTIHEATSVTLQNGRLYVADHDGGIAILK
ncbi:MAG: hypothetical protein AB7T06_30130 [Kofleriaceae bacterium]